MVRWTGLIWPLEIVVLLWPVGMVSVLNGTIDDGYGGMLGWFWVACAVTTIGLVVVTRAALRERYYSAVMAATGLLYLAILTAFGTDLVARAVLVRLSAGRRGRPTGRPDRGETGGGGSPCGPASRPHRAVGLSEKRSAAITLCVGMLRNCNECAAPTCSGSAVRRMPWPPSGLRPTVDAVTTAPARRLRPSLIPRRSGCSRSGGQPDGRGRDRGDDPPRRPPRPVPGAGRRRRAARPPRELADRDGAGRALGARVGLQPGRGRADRRRHAGTGRDGSRSHPRPCRCSSTRPTRCTCSACSTSSRRPWRCWPTALPDSFRTGIGHDYDTLGPEARGRRRAGLRAVDAQPPGRRPAARASTAWSTG